MPSRWRWIVVVTAATGLDLLARFGASFDFRRVMHLEALLFPVTGAVLATLLRTEAITRGWPHGVRVGLLWMFGLGGLRPLLWTLGLSLMVANLTTLIAGLVATLVWMLRRRRPRAQLPAGSSHHEA